METVVKINGGLGNQMFQYALVMELRNRGIICYADYTELNKKGNQHQGYELQRAFNIQELCPQYIRFKYKTLFRLSFNRVCKKYINIGSDYFFYEDDKHHNFVPQILERKTGYLTGYWQSEKYFSNITNIIRSKYIFIPDELKENEECKAMMNNTQSVSLHIRRGDYLKPEIYSTFGGICNESYYQSAMARIEEMIGDVHYFVFSNDPLYVQSTDLLLGKSYTLVDWNTGINSFRDMELMCACKHNIIANSSFSWWGAWLNRNPNKIVIAPSRWSNRENDFMDIVPQQWLAI